MSDLRALIDAAKVDGPSAAAKAKVWAGVSSAVGGAASASAGAAASMGAAKMLVLGTLLGGALTVGMGAAMLVVRSQPVRTAGAPAPATALTMPQAILPVLGTAEAPPPPSTLVVQLAAHVVNPPPVARAAPAQPEPVAIDDIPLPPATEVAAPAAVPQVHRSPAVRAAPAPVAHNADDDALAREASLLASARNALAQRDALTALQIVRGLASLPSRQLVPEEMAVEAQALRGLGLADQASAVDATLHAKFPDSVLGR
ncbi:MAG TPA: hypothetical protein VHV30_01110 [Polyangiaceae bacterium]|jgi:hypothetical protein|nr:hypothetical protein [Polyangiaceae bacterium]